MRRIISFFGVVMVLTTLVLTISITLMVLTISITLMLTKPVLPIADAQQDNQNMTESNTMNGMMNMMQDD